MNSVVFFNRTKPTNKMNQLIKRNRFLSDCRPSFSQSQAEVFPMTQFFPESPKISNLELKGNFQELQLDEPLNEKDRASVLAPWVSSVCEKIPEISTSKEIQEDSLEIETQRIPKLETEIEIEMKKTENECQEWEECEDVLKDFDDVSVICVVNDSFQNDRKQRMRGFFGVRERRNECIGKRGFEIFKETGNGGDEIKRGENEEYDRMIREEARHTKNLLTNLFQYQKKSLEERCHRGRRRCKSFYGLGERQIFKFMKENKK